jgi:hypothetical protein
MDKKGQMKTSQFHKMFELQSIQQITNAINGKEE